MIFSVLRLEDKHESYSKKNLSFDYMTPEQFDETIGNKEKLYGEINLLKPYKHSYTEETEWESCDIVSIPDREDKYRRYYEVLKVKKSHKKKAFGYIEVNVQNTIRYIRVMECKDTLLPFLLIFGVVALIGLTALIKFQNTGTQVIESQPTLEMAEGKKWDGKLPERYQEETDNKGGIAIAGYTNLLVTADHQQIDLINIDWNAVYQRYRIFLNGKELFDSKLIAPGETVAWNAYENLENGHYQLDFDISTYDLETQAPDYGATQVVSLEVKKSE